MGWSETYYRDYEAQTRLAWEKRARGLLEEMELFLLQVKEDANLLGLEDASYQKLVMQLQQRINEDFLQ
jgi:hypothetical protein